MTPLKFLDRVPAMTGGKAAILARTGELQIDGEHKWPVNGSRKQHQKSAVDLLLQAIREQLRGPLEKVIDNHLAHLEQEYILLEGEPPEDNDERVTWDLGLGRETEESLAEVAQVVGAKDLRDWVYSNAPTSHLVDLLLEKAISDPANAFQRLDIKPGDIDSLIPREPSTAAMADRTEEFARRHGVEDGAAETPADEAEPARAASHKRQHAETSDRTEAAKGVLNALKGHVADADVAKALNLSRASIINYRDGKTNWLPDATQVSILRTQVADVVKPLLDAMDALLKASVE